MASDFTWDQRLRRYRGPDGRLMSKTEANRLRDEFIDQQVRFVDSLVDLLLEDKITMRDFQRELEERLRRSYMGQYAYGRGGRAMMTQSDYGRVGAILRNQYSYLRQFLNQIDDGELTPARIKQRASMYIGSSREAFNKGRQQSWGISLPVHPARNTKCGSNCKCSWDIRTVGDDIHATWELGGTSDHCVDCLDFASAYNPLIFHGAAGASVS